MEPVYLSQPRALSKSKFATQAFDDGAELTILLAASAASEEILSFESRNGLDFDRICFDF